MSENSTPEGVRPEAPLAGDLEQTAESGVSVVGIGASAGGLEAFRLLLRELPADTGFAFVLIQHLDPKHQSSLSDILGRATAMPVREAVDGLPVEPGHVYVIPPNAELTIAGRVLRLSARSQTPGPHMLIDLFFRSLAQDCGSRAIGVILSGAGSDGALGLQAVKETGGTTFAQEPGTAEFAGMPQRAEAGACVDFVLPPARIAAELARISRHPHFSVIQPAEPEVQPPEAGLEDILSVMREATGVDFSLYRETTIHRRIMRRLALRNVASTEEYVTLLKQDPGERNSLQRDLLISVTRFFRDPASFDALAKAVFPEIVRDRPPDLGIRIWVPGCATGEEAYSIAISLQDYLIEAGAAFPVQIFASDVNEATIEKARSGIYLESIASDVTPERLARYFTRIEGGYQVSKALRETCIFSRHNLINDPPFGRMDLVSCRNVLIYLGSVQKNVISLFHYALRTGGFLMLGQSETATYEGMFSPIDRDHRIYAKRETTGTTRGSHARAGIARWGGDARKKLTEASIPGLRDRVKAVDGILLSKYSPAGVLVDEGLEVLEIRGDVTPFFRLPAGRASFHLLKLAPDTGLFLEIEKLVREAAEQGAAVRQERVPYEGDGAIREVNIEATPLADGQRRLAFVLLEPARRIGEAGGESPDKPAAYDEAAGVRDLQIAKLRREVAEARRRLLTTIEESRISDEASQSAAEEALSANEELQSLNEELETAKEELQSTNEELFTLNRELESKNVAITESRDEVQTALHQSQEALRRAETMEAIGRLAGGIAHDFNNLLTAIVGYANLVGGTLAGDHPAVEYVREIERAGQKAAALTDQLLAFGRRKVLQPRVFDLNGVVADFESMLRRALGERIRVVVRAASDLWRVRADPGEIGRALMNLCLNARDAMPAGGVLTIRTANVAIAEAEAGTHHLGAGEYVELDVCDTGVGMDPHVMAHLFEPFFTTKETGKGTGLGLATVFGIVEQSGGAIWCESEPGEGTTFKILLPAAAGIADPDERPASTSAEWPRGSAEVVLLVEDEDQVRTLTRRVLEGLGYVVLEARDGPRGLSVGRGHQGKIDLLLSDVVMPELGGRELAERILAIRPNLKVLFMSGHTQDVILKEGIKAGVPFLQKPFSPADLAHKVRAVLDSEARSGNSGNA